MHEYAIVAALLERVEELADERDALGVKAVWVRIGELSGVEPELLTAAYHDVREGTVCERAELHVTFVPVRWACRDCGAAIPTGERLACPACAGVARLASGDGVLLEKVELDAP